MTDKYENRYQGRFERGKLNGRVNVRYANGDTYQGEYKDGKKSGHGVQTYTALQETNYSEESATESGTYTGNWKRDLREGLGRMQWSDGTRYEGSWL